MRNIQHTLVRQHTKYAEQGIKSMLYIYHSKVLLLSMLDTLLNVDIMRFENDVPKVNYSMEKVLGQFKNECVKII